MMKFSAMRELTVEELEAQVEENRKKLFNLRFQHSLNQLGNTAEIRVVKHQIAQLLTVLQSKKQTGGKVHA